ncbi:MAG: NifB/NifX family molybdenum-iron cluster-binding protein [Thermodesulfobacteriota bacterium]
MKAAFSIWKDRIAPVFDVTPRVCLVEAEAGRIVRETEADLPDGSPAAGAAWLAGRGVDSLVCGAISRPVQAVVSAHGVRVIGFIAGELRVIIQGWLEGRLEQGGFAMPGCRGRGGRGRFQGACRLEQEDYAMRGKGQGGGRGGGLGRGGPRRGARGGPLAAGPDGFCLCPQCGHREPHQRGRPCVERKCPRCGIAMTRE